MISMTIIIAINVSLKLLGYSKLTVKLKLRLF